MGDSSQGKDQMVSGLTMEAQEPGDCIRIQVDLRRARPLVDKRGSREEIWPYRAWLYLFSVCHPQRKTTNTCLVS